MLKDAGRLAAAETEYRSALAQRPDDPDVHLQLGHCLKLQGRRAAALEAYERAAGLAPLAIGPRTELFHMGQRTSQEYLFETQLRLGGVEALSRITHQIVEKRARENAERDVIDVRWGAAMDSDPGLNPVWHMATLPFRLLSAPSQNRLWAHIERCASADPWLPEMRADRLRPERDA
jgi:hypothetical protein